MELKPGYKETDVGVIPEDWEVIPLGKGLSGRPGYGINAPAVPYSDRLPAYIRITDITEDGRYDPSNPVSVKSADSEKYFLEDGDIVFARTGASVGKSYKYRPCDGRLVFAGFLIRVHPDSINLHAPYVAAYITTGPYWRWVQLMSMRSGQPGINGNEYAMLPIPKPPITEQRAIATALSDVDALLDGLDRLIAKKRDLKQAAMQQLLTGETRLPGFEGEWEETSIGKLATLRNGYAFKSSTYTNNGMFRVITIANVQDGRMDLTECNTVTDLPNDLQPHHQLRIGDLLISMTGNVGRVCRVTHSLCLLNQRVGLLYPIAVSSEFLFHLLSQRSFLISMVGKAKGGAQGNLSKSDISDYTLLVPTDPKEQTAIATVLSDMDAEIAALEQRRNKTKDIKQAMMQELLTGKTRLVTPVENAHNMEQA